MFEHSILSTEAFFCPLLEELSYYDRKKHISLKSYLYPSKKPSNEKKDIYYLETISPQYKDIHEQKEIEEQETKCP